jgi:hypothetical protein
MAAKGRPAAAADEPVHPDVDAALAIVVAVIGSQRDDRGPPPALGRGSAVAS